MLGTCVMLSAIPANAYAVVFQKKVAIPREFQGMSPDKICIEKQKLSSEKLISEIKEVEKIDNSANNDYLMTMLVALTEKKADFSEDQLIEMMQDSTTGNGLNEAFVQIYADNKFDEKKLIKLLDDDNLDLTKKEAIVSNSHLSVDDLSYVFKNQDNTLSILAMKQIAVADKTRAVQLSLPIFQNLKSQSDEKVISACLGMASYYENDLTNKSFEREKGQAIEKMKKVFHESKNELVKDQAVYAVSRICDYETFQRLIESDAVDFDLKVSAIERNIDKMMSRIDETSTKSDLKAIFEAMRLHPIFEVGERLQKAIDDGRLESDKETIELLKYIEKEGLRGAYKNEKQ